MNEVQIFNNSEFGEIRTVILENEPWFVAKDISGKLGYAQVANMSKLIDADDRQVISSSILDEQVRNGYKQAYQITVINESGLYAAIFGSKQENAKKFKKWVTSEVLPSIRKTGSYGQNAPLTLQQQIQVVAQGYMEINQRVDTVEIKVKELENTMTLDYGQQSVLGDTVSKTVISALGGKDSSAYKSLGRKVFAECNHDLKSYFKVNARANVPKKRFYEAVSYAENWKPCTNTVMLINAENAQQTLF